MTASRAVEKFSAGAKEKERTEKAGPGSWVQTTEGVTEGGEKEHGCRSCAFVFDVSEEFIVIF